MADRVVRSILQWAQDTASLAKTIAGNKAVADSVVNESKRAASAQVQSNNAVTVSYADAAATAKGLGLTVEELAARTGIVVQKEQQAIQTTRELAAANDQLASSVQKVGSAQGGINVGQIAGRTAGLGAVLGSQAGGQALPAVAQIIQLGAAFGPLGVVIGAVAGASRILTADAEKTTEALKKSSIAFQALQVNLPETNLADLQRRLDAAFAKLPIAEALAQQANQGVVDYVQAHPSFVIPVTGIISERIGGLAGTFGALQGSADNANTTVRDLQDEIANLQLTLAGAVPTTADLAEEAQKLADVQLEAANRAVEIDRMTAAQRDERAAQNDREVNVLTRLIGAGGLSIETVTELAAQITDLNADTAELNSVSESYADVLEREKAAKEALTERNSQMIDLINQEVDARDKIIEIEKKIAEVVADREARSAEIIAERDDRINELTEEGGERRAEIIADSEAKILKLQRDSGQTQFNLIATRDALAFKLEQQRVSKAVGDEKDASKKSLDQQKKGEDKSLAQQIKQADKQLATQVNSGQKQLNTLYDQKRQEEFIVASSKASQLFLTQTGMANINNATVTGLNLIQQNFATALINIAGMVTGYLSGRSGGSSFPTLTSSDGGVTSSQAFNQAFDRRFNQTINASSGIRGPI